MGMVFAEVSVTVVETAGHAKIQNIAGMDDMVSRVLLLKARDVELV